jgi:hypothetical protein
MEPKQFFLNIHMKLISFLIKGWLQNRIGESLLRILKSRHHQFVTLLQTLSHFSPFDLLINVREFLFVRLEDSTSTESERSSQ